MDISARPHLDLRWILHYTNGQSVVGCWNKDFAKVDKKVVKFSQLNQNARSIDIQMRDHFSHKKLTQLSLRGEGQPNLFKFEIDFNMLAGGIKKCVYFDDNLVVSDKRGNQHQKKVDQGKSSQKQRIIVPFLYGFKVKMFNNEVLQSVLTFDRYLVLYKENDNDNMS